MAFIRCKQLKVWLASVAYIASSCFLCTCVWTRGCSSVSTYSDIAAKHLKCRILGQQVLFYLGPLLGRGLFMILNTDYYLVCSHIGLNILLF